MLGFRHRQSEHPRIEQIRKVGLFATLKQPELRVIDGLLYERQYLKDEIVFDEDEEGQALYVVLRGKILICRQGEPVSGFISEIPAGVLFGELALLDGAPRAAQARAADDCVLASLSRADFKGLIDEHAVIASKILFQLACELGARLRDRSRAREREPL